LFSETPALTRCRGFLLLYSIFRDSQAVRQRTVNEPIAGSNPALGASFEVLAVSEAASRDSPKVECLVRIQDDQPKFVRKEGKRQPT
jgi:hypothetical protein